MLTTIELNFYSHLVVDSNNNEVGYIHYLPDADWDTQPWKAYIEGVEVFSYQSFMGCFRYIQNQYMKGNLLVV